MLKLLSLFFLLSMAFAAFYEEEFQRMMKELNEKNLKLTWKPGLNPYFKGKSEQEIRRLLGARSRDKDILPVRNVIAKAVLPEQFDSRNHWGYCKSIGQIRDQSACGSCWAVSSASVMSDRQCIASKGALQPYLSDEYVLSCCSSCGYGCFGGITEEAFRFWNFVGVPTGGPYASVNGCQPYSIQCPACDLVMTPTCKDHCIPHYPLKLEQDKYYGQTAYIVRGGVKAYMQEILNNGPVVASYDVYADFFYYKSGVYQHLWGDYKGGHAVRVIGWGVEKGVPYWLVTNSWNVTFGEKGLFKILRGSNNCMVEKKMVAGMPRRRF